MRMYGSTWSGSAVSSLKDNLSTLKDNLSVDLSSMGNTLIKAGQEARVSPPQECARIHRFEKPRKAYQYRFLEV